jgi:protein-S-isoprenylcysteine O-methyltransferase Ste14
VPSLTLAVLGALWLAWCAYWLVSAYNVKASRRKESWPSRTLHIAPMSITVVLMVAPRLPIGWLNLGFLPATVATVALGLILVATGLGFAVCARVHLGRNWSGQVTLKQEHELILSGPYRLVRHPIYSGLLAAVLGTAILIGQWRGLVALAFFASAVLRRVRVEERWLDEIFPDVYASYRREVPALVPFVTAAGLL